MDKEAAIAQVHSFLSDHCLYEPPVEDRNEVLIVAIHRTPEAFCFLFFVTGDPQLYRVWLPLADMTDWETADLASEDSVNEIGVELLIWIGDTMQFLPETSPQRIGADGIVDLLDPWASSVRSSSTRTRESGSVAFDSITNGGLLVCTDDAGIPDVPQTDQAD